MALGYDSDGAAIQRHSFGYQRSTDQDASPPRCATRWWWWAPARWA